MAAPQKTIVPLQAVMENPASASWSAQVFARLTRLAGFRLPTDIHEWTARAGIRLPMGRRRRERMALVARRGILFIHVPKNAGTSIATALYGRTLSHQSIRYYQDVAPELARDLPSFAILRDPVDRFLSAYSYARNGGTRDRTVAPEFRDLYMGFRSLDDALDHVEQARSIYGMDHIFRPQSWYVADRAGRPAVRHLLRIDDMAHLSDLMPELGPVRLPRLNEGRPHGLVPTERQRARILAAYQQDVALFDGIATA
ncbi:sulfotransferase family 2 domain-containing protein [Gluconacetobacter sp. Hr-1-5]|uniref:sulfotransferase family 2 domain-containing protein n=1 Tax=Gluconacetobacter sp. Hr-1-5 TaxID=3395370 RepID=UPI003B5224C2